ncbi:hypothetical protein Acsp02_88770 [Actinoplanes sp. NBRC 103695]|nr:hypothetical protein Acsp02_88770 [Actinoplanes sp. NBRC 103695]
METFSHRAPAAAGRPRRRRAPLRNSVLDPGDLVELTASASVRFADSRALRLRVTHADPRPTYSGWVWLHGYSVDQDGTVIEQREVFVQLAGLRRISTIRPCE